MTETKVIHEIFDTFKLKRTQKGFGPFGDDAVVIPQVSPQDQLVLSTDTFTWGSHFDEKTPVESIGYKALVASISDITAMGAQPSFFMLNLILPKEYDFKKLIRGLYKASIEYNLSLLGGDVVCGEDLSLSITAGGFQPISQSLKNTGAKAGDFIFTEASLGHALLGFEECKKNIKSEFVDEFYYPKTPVDIGLWLSKKDEVTSLRDISDGLLIELKQFSSSHKLSVKAFSPTHKPSFLNACKKSGLNPDEIYFKGGEEYNLMWTLKKELKEEFINSYKQKFSTSPMCLGEVIELGDKPPKIYFEPNQSLIDSIIPFEHFSS